VVADRGYDSEELMQYIEHEIRAKPIIALKHMSKPLKRTRGEIRKRLKKAFPEEEYHQRSKSETVNSTIKRRYESIIRARKNHTQRTDALLKILTHNLNLLSNMVEILKDFYRAQKTLHYQSPGYTNRISVISDTWIIVVGDKKMPDYVDSSGQGISIDPNKANFHR